MKRCATCGRAVDDESGMVAYVRCPWCAGVLVDDPYGPRTLSDALQVIYSVDTTWPYTPNLAADALHDLAPYVREAPEEVEGAVRAGAIGALERGSFGSAYETLLSSGWDPSRANCLVQAYQTLRTGPETLIPPVPLDPPPTPFNTVVPTDPNAVVSPDAKELPLTPPVPGSSDTKPQKRGLMLPIVLGVVAVVIIALALIVFLRVRSAGPTVDDFEAGNLFGVAMDDTTLIDFGSFAGSDAASLRGTNEQDGATVYEYRVLDEEVFPTVLVNYCVAMGMGFPTWELVVADGEWVHEYEFKEMRAVDVGLNYVGKGEVGTGTFDIGDEDSPVGTAHMLMQVLAPAVGDRILKIYVPEGVSMHDYGFTYERCQELIDHSTVESSLASLSDTDSGTTGGDTDAGTTGGDTDTGPTVDNKDADTTVDDKDAGPTVDDFEAGNLFGVAMDDTTLIDFGSFAGSDVVSLEGTTERDHSTVYQYRILDEDVCPTVVANYCVAIDMGFPTWELVLANDEYAHEYEFNGAPALDVGLDYVGKGEVDKGDFNIGDEDSPVGTAHMLVQLIEPEDGDGFLNIYVPKGASMHDYGFSYKRCQELIDQISA